MRITRIATERRHSRRSISSRCGKTFGDACEVMTVVNAEGRPVSGVLSFYFRDEVLPYYAGDVSEARELAANDFKYWELMRRACERGCRIFDYGRSKRGTGLVRLQEELGLRAATAALRVQAVQCGMTFRRTIRPIRSTELLSGCGVACRGRSSMRSARLLFATWDRACDEADAMLSLAPSSLAS